MPDTSRADEAPALALFTTPASAGAVPAGDAFRAEVPLRVYCLRCGKPYASNDGVRKHSKRYHPQWMAEMDARREAVSTSSPPENVEAVRLHAPPPRGSRAFKEEADAVHANGGAGAPPFAPAGAGGAAGAGPTVWMRVGQPLHSGAPCVYGAPPTLGALHLAAEPNQLPLDAMANAAAGVARGFGPYVAHAPTPGYAVSAMVGGGAAPAAGHTAGVLALAAGGAPLAPAFQASGAPAVGLALSEGGGGGAPSPTAAGALSAAQHAMVPTAQAQAQQHAAQHAFAHAHAYDGVPGGLAAAQLAAAAQYGAAAKQCAAAGQPAAAARYEAAALHAQQAAAASLAVANAPPLWAHSPGCAQPQPLALSAAAQPPPQPQPQPAAPPALAELRTDESTTSASAEAAAEPQAALEEEEGIPRDVTMGSLSNLSLLAHGLPRDATMSELPISESFVDSLSLSLSEENFFRASLDAPALGAEPAPEPGTPHAPPTPSAECASALAQQLIFNALTDARDEPPRSQPA